MTLAGVKRKQRLSSDPRNETWARDTSRIGYHLLTRMGWKEGTGLGLESNGMQRPIQSTLKNDALGIGFSNDPEHEWKLHCRSLDALYQRIQNPEQVQDQCSPTEGPLLVEKCMARVAFRSRFVRGKNTRLYSTEAMNEILGNSSNTLTKPEINQKTELKEANIDMKSYFEQKMKERGLLLNRTEEKKKIDKEESEMPMASFEKSLKPEENQNDEYEKKQKKEKKAKKDKKDKKRNKDKKDKKDKTEKKKGRKKEKKRKEKRKRKEEKSKK